MKRVLPRTRSAIAGFGIVLLIVQCGVAFLLGSDLEDSREREFELVTREATSLAGLIEINVRASADKIDAVLREAVADYTPVLRGQASVDIAEANRDLLRREASIPEAQVRSLRVIDANGDVRYSAGETAALPNVNVSDRSYFQQQRSDTRAGLVLSEPIKSRFTGQWLFTLSRRIEFPDGTFAGLVQTALRADHFQSVFRSVDVGPQGIVALFSLDSRLIARQPAIEGKTGTVFDLSEIELGLKRGESAGMYQRVSRVDGIERVYHYRQVSDLPLVANIGIALDDFLHGWRQKAWLYGIAWLALGGALLLLFLAIVRHASRIESLNEQLADEVRRADAASQAKSIFLANMSHEIRTPLNAIVGLTHLLQRSDVTSEQAERLGRISVAADHLLSVISDVLDLSKIEAGKIVLESEVFEREELLHRVASIIDERIQAKGLELVIDVVDVPATLKGDLTRLGQALLNYLGNAVKFTERGYVALRIRTVGADGDRVCLRFEVEDTGCGIAPEAQARLFAAFEQADASTTRRYGGTGLGLSITRHIAQLMEGEAGLSSRPGEGSVFWFTAWLERVASRPQENPQFSGRALIVDDLPIVRAVGRNLLGQLGMRAESAASGQEAASAIEAADVAGDPYALVLLERETPEAEGEATLARIKAMPLQAMPLFILTCNTGSLGQEASARGVGFAAVLRKPLGLTGLARAIITAQGRKPAVEQADAEEAPEVLLRRLHGGTRVLLVDDEPINRTLGEAFLRDVGFDVTLAIDGRHAVDLVAAGERFDLILTDMLMPEMDGIEATQRIRQLPNGRDVLIIAMSAAVFAEDRAKCLVAGMNDFVAKPVKPKALNAVLWKWLSRVDV